MEFRMIELPLKQLRLVLIPSLIFLICVILSCQEISCILIRRRAGWSESMH